MMVAVVVAVVTFVAVIEVIVVIVVDVVVAVVVASTISAAVASLPYEENRLLWKRACRQKAIKIKQTIICLLLAWSQYTDTGPTSPSADPITPGAWQGSNWSANFRVTGMTRPKKISVQVGFEPGIFRSRGGRLTTRPTRRSSKQ